MMHMCSIELAWARADVATAQRHSTELRRLADKFEMPYLRIFIRGYEGLAATASGDHEAARKHFDQALAELRRSGAAREFETEVLAGLAESCLRMGETELAHRYAHEAIELSRARATRIAHARALIARATAWAAMGMGSGETAEADLREAESLIRDCGAAMLQRSLDTVRETLRAVRAA
jgi:tetratricopeptide (TPR) repeat protein